MCLSSLQVNASELQYEHPHFSDDDDERAVQVCLKMKEMSVLLSGFITLNSGVFCKLLSSATFFPPSCPHPHIAIQTPTQLSDPSPWLSEVIFTQRRPLIGSQ